MDNIFIKKLRLKQEIANKKLNTKTSSKEVKFPKQNINKNGYITYEQDDQKGVKDV